MKVLRAGLIALTAALVVWTSAPAVRSADAVDQTPFMTGLTEPAALTTALDAHLTAAQQHLDRLVTVTGVRTVENTLRPYDDSAYELSQAAGAANVVARSHPDASMREAADAVLVRARTLEAARLQNRQVYDALRAIETKGLDAETRYYLTRELAAFRRNGVDKSPEVRAQVADLQQKLAEAIGMYRRNVGGVPATITVPNVAALDGLPQDFVDRHKPGPLGEVTLRAEGSDYPVMLFARSEDLRKRWFTEFANIAYPINIAPLKRFVDLRWQIAQALGFRTWADRDADSRMVQTSARASEFIDGVMSAARPKADREYAELVKRKQQDVPGATTINAWEFEYYREQVRRSTYDFDSRSVRPYLAYDRVRQAMLDMTSRMFGVTYRRAANIPVWHPSVEVFDVLDAGQLIGRVYFDAHPRPDKQIAGGSVTYVATSGLSGRRITEAVILMNLPGGQPGDPGLLTFQNVYADLFHEFGHAINRVLAGHPRWSGLREEAEDDYREVIGRLFELFAESPSMISAYARHYQTNEPMPPPLVDRMRRATEFSKGMQTVGNLATARYALELHLRDPKTTDPSVLYRQLMTADAPWLYAEGTHREAAFTQIANTNYQSAYYTYWWSLVIAYDIMQAFDPNDIVAPGPAHRLRDLVMQPGGSKPAAELIREFLGRPFDRRAWTAWINQDPS